jgi:hypothetical protein
MRVIKKKWYIPKKKSNVPAFVTENNDNTVGS